MHDWELYHPPNVRAANTVTEQKLTLATPLRYAVGISAQLS